MKTLSLIVRIAFRNIVKHPVKNALVGVIVLLGTCLFLFTAAITDDSTREWRRYFSTTFVGGVNVTAFDETERDYTLPAFGAGKKWIDPRVEKALDAKGVPHSRRLKVGGAIYNEETGGFEGSLCTLIATDVPGELGRLMNLTIGRGGWDPAVANGVLVWHDFAEERKWKPGDEVSLFLKDVDGNSYPYTFVVSGILYHRDGISLAGMASTQLFPLMWCSYDHLSRSLGIEDGRANEIAVWPRDARETRAVRSLAKSCAHDAYFAENAFGSLAGIVGAIGSFGILTGAIILIVLIVATLNLNLVSFFDRQREIGTMLAVGAKPRWIVALLSTEIALFSLLAFAVSLAVFLGICLAGSGGMDLGQANIIFAGNRLRLAVSPSAALGTLIAILGAMALSSLYPISITARIRPIEVFREDTL